MKFLNSVFVFNCFVFLSRVMILIVIPLVCLFETVVGFPFYVYHRTRDGLEEWDDWVRKTEKDRINK